MPALLEKLVDQGGSSLHLTAESPPLMRVDGSLRRVDELPLTSEEVQALVYSVLRETQQTHFARDQQLEFAFGLKGVGRFRASLFRQRGAPAASLTQIPPGVPALATLGLPAAAEGLTERTQGLVLIAGGTGSGRSTTLTALLDHINHTRAVHILTVEQPIEYVLSHQRAQITQREVPLDTPSVAATCRFALRADVDVAAIGEIRDHESALWALRMAEEGLLVFATIFAGSAVQALNHLVDHFPASEQPHALFQLAGTLEGVLYQALIPRPAGKGRATAVEVLLPDAEMRRLISTDDLEAVEQRLVRGWGAPGSCSLNEALAGLVDTNRVTRDAAQAARRTPPASQRWRFGLAWRTRGRS